MSVVPSRADDRDVAHDRSRDRDLDRRGRLLIGMDQNCLPKTTQRQARFEGKLDHVAIDCLAHLPCACQSTWLHLFLWITVGRNGLFQLIGRQRLKRHLVVLLGLSVDSLVTAQLQRPVEVAHQPQLGRGRLANRDLAEHNIGGGEAYRAGDPAGDDQSDPGPIRVVCLNRHRLAIGAGSPLGRPSDGDLARLAGRDRGLPQFADSASARRFAGRQLQGGPAHIAEDEVVRPLGRDVHRPEIVVFAVDDDLGHGLPGCRSGGRFGLPRGGEVALPRPGGEPQRGDRRAHGQAEDGCQDECQEDSHGQSHVSQDAVRSPAFRPPNETTSPPDHRQTTDTTSVSGGSGPRVKSAACRDYPAGAGTGLLGFSRGGIRTVDSVGMR